MNNPESRLRYQGKPLLRLLECYVLWAMDELPEADLHTLKEMAPKLRSIYAAQGDWQQVIATAVQLPPNMPAVIKELWHKNGEIARRSGKTLIPQQFAEMFVDQNLV